MTNWPNIQEYRNFEAKFFDDPKNSILTDSAADSDLETVIKDEYKAKIKADDFLNNQKLQNPESKTVRCVIRKDFEEAFKKLEREDAVPSNHELVRHKPLEPAPNRSPDKIRLQNHMKWKKQKEEEYLQKKEAERLAQQKKKEEELRLEKLKKQKEKERDEKLREWEEQKAREKEEKKKEKMAIKKLEDKLKVTPSVDKEKLMEEWVKLKNKQKQIEAEKKAKLMRKEEETKALRQSLAELSYRQWKERVKGRTMSLPKNGYQIFGPKPAPVVKEDWNNDFINNSPVNQNYHLRNTKSNTSNFSFSPVVKEIENLSKDLYYFGELKSRSPSFCHLKTINSGLAPFENSEALSKVQYEMPLKELQPGTIDLKKKGTKPLKAGFENIKSDFSSHNLGTKSEINFLTNHIEWDTTDIMSFPSVQADQNRYIVSSHIKKSSELLNTLPGAQVLPNKKKIDLYINTRTDNNEEEDSEAKAQKKQTNKTTKEVKKNLGEKKSLVQTGKNISKEKFCQQNRTRSLSLQKFDKNAKDLGKKAKERENAKVKACRSQSCDKPVKTDAKNDRKMKSCSSFKSILKVSATVNEPHSNLRIEKSKTCCNQKRKNRKTDWSEVVASKSEKKLFELESKTKKKLKKKNMLSKSFSFCESPYCTKNTLKSYNRVKAGRRKNTNDVETKSDEGGHSRKLSTNKT